MQSSSMWSVLDLYGMQSLLRSLQWLSLTPLRNFDYEPIYWGLDRAKSFLSCWKNSWVTLICNSFFWSYTSHVPFCRVADDAWMQTICWLMSDWHMYLTVLLVGAFCCVAQIHTLLLSRPICGEQTYDTCVTCFAWCRWLPDILKLTVKWKTPQGTFWVLHLVCQSLKESKHSLTSEWISQRVKKTFELQARNEYVAYEPLNFQKFSILVYVASLQDALIFFLLLVEGLGKGGKW